MIQRCKKTVSREIPDHILKASVYNVLVTDGRLVIFANKIYDMGIETVEDYITSDEGELFSKARLAKGAQARVKSIFLKLGIPI